MELLSCRVALCQYLTSGKISSALVQLTCAISRPELRAAAYSFVIRGTAKGNAHTRQQQRRSQQSTARVPA